MKTLKEIQAEYELTPLDVLLFKRINKEWLTQKLQPVEGMSMRNNVKALLVLQGRQAMLEELIKEL